MAFGTILVHCDADKKLPLRLDIATELAERFGSHLVGLHVRPPFQPPVVFDSGFAVAMDDFYRMYEESTKADQDAASAAFAGAVKDKKISSEWRTIEAVVDDGVIDQSRYADLIVVGQNDPETPTPTPADFPQSVALASGRPVLVVPYIGGRKSLGKTVLLCWNASRECAHAATEALPILQKAGKVIVLVAGDEDARVSRGAKAVAWLGRNGVKATVESDVAADADVGELIVSRAADLDADLIVMGIYGHSRIREMVLGGASRTLLASMTVPVFMVH